MKRQFAVAVFGGALITLVVLGGVYGVWRVVRMHRHDVATVRAARLDEQRVRLLARYAEQAQRDETRAMLARVHVLVRCQAISDPRHLTTAVAMERVGGKVRVVVSGKLVCP